MVSKNSQKTQNVFDSQPLHSEQGFLRIIDDKKLEMVVAQPTGIVEVHDGFYASNPESCLINLHATQVSGTATAKPVEQVQRLLRIADNVLTYNVSMAAGGEPPAAENMQRAAACSVHHATACSVQRAAVCSVQRAACSSVQRAACSSVQRAAWCSVHQRAVCSVQ